MYWIDEIPDILKFTIISGQDYPIKEDKHYKEIDGEVYIQFSKDENNNLYRPNIYKYNVKSCQEQ